MHYLTVLLLALVLLSSCAPGPDAPATQADQMEASGAQAASPAPVEATFTPRTTASPAATSAAVATTVDELLMEAAAETPEPPALTPPTLPTATLAVVEVISGQLPEGAFFLGDADAPLTVIDYSDFL